MTDHTHLRIPQEGTITVCEQNGELVSIEDGGTAESFLRGQVATLPVISIAPESLRRTVGAIGESAKAAFLEHKETTFQKLQSAWYSHGVTGVLAEISSEEMEDGEIHPVLRSICHYLLLGLRQLGGMKFSLFPHLTLSQEELISSFSPNKDWSKSLIRFMAWHPRANKFAVALRDDTIKVHYANNSLVPVLKHKLQKSITCVEWKPLSASVLAVGTQAAVLIWSVDPSSFSTRPSSGAVQVLAYSGHNPVTSLAWDPRGDDLLVACSALNTAIVVWNACLAEYQVIQHVTTCGGVSRVMWSPDGSKVLAATPSASFRVFETRLWTNERWSNLSGRVQCACWSPRGTNLLFALKGDPHVYCVSFDNPSKTDSPSASGSSHGKVVLDLTPPRGADGDGQDDEAEVSDYIHSMIWDETGERVAMMFHKNDPRHGLVAVYATVEEPVFIITPKGYIQGKDGVDPVFIAFKPNYDMGACLSVCWSDGDIRHIPMYFSASSAINEQLQFSAADPYAGQSTADGSFSRRTMWSTMDSVFQSEAVM